MRLMPAFLLAVGVFGQDVPRANPIPDRLCAEIAMSQRDYLIAQRQLDAALLAVKEKLGQAEKICAGQDAVLDAMKLVCRSAEKK
jgi:hypothetical protein